MPGYLRCRTSGNFNPVTDDISAVWSSSSPSHSFGQYYGIGLTVYIYMSRSVTLTQEVTATTRMT